MNKKALSPVVKSIILIAVTVAVSIAVAAWMGALTVGLIKDNNIEFEFQIPVKYNADTISFTAQDIDIGISHSFSASKTLCHLPYILSGTVANNTRIEIHVTYYATEQQDTVVTYEKVGEYTFQLLVKSGGD